MQATSSGSGSHSPFPLLTDAFGPVYTKLHMRWAVPLSVDHCPEFSDQNNRDTCWWVITGDCNIMYINIVCHNNIMIIMLYVPLPCVCMYIYTTCTHVFAIWAWNYVCPVYAWIIYRQYFVLVQPDHYNYTHNRWKHSYRINSGSTLCFSNCMEKFLMTVLH